MSRLQAIENALIAINETVFQELCDSFLILRNENYKAFLRSGSQVGKQKTTKGTPDSFFLLPDGKYVFIEYSTNITEGVSKLIKDVQKCIDTGKTGIPVKDIAEIIICINFNLKLGEVQKLKDVLSKTSIKLTVYNLDALSLELHIQHRDLVHTYLGLSLDTGQIVSMDRFIDEYNKASKGIATPLDNPFLHRQKELQDLNNLMLQDDLVILYGSPGVGKTKLALETIKDFIKENPSYNAFCISYKNATLIDDLYSYLNLEKDYILLVDDANRIDAFSQVIGFYKAHRAGNLKILITVRDYALYVVEMLCIHFLSRAYSINKFTDEQIVDVVKEEPFGILNPDYHKEIIRIADGNPRLAIMAAQLAKEKQNIGALYDVSDLFEKYFLTFVRDDGRFANSNNIKTLGIIAFFNALPYKEKDVIVPILENFNINYDTFIDCIDQLDKLELIEIQFEHVRISEQNLSMYFFYKSFVKDNLLSFETLLNKYFENNTSRFKDCVIPANNTFGHQNVMGKIKPVLQDYWKSIKHDEERSLKLLSEFWFYLQNETLEFVYNLVEKLPESQMSSYEVSYGTNDFVYSQNRIIELLANFFRLENNLKEVIELSFEYIRKLPQHFPELLHKIREQLIFDRIDAGFEFSRQRVLFKVLIDGLNRRDLLYSKAFFELSKTFLSFKFQQFELGRNNSFSFYDYPLSNNTWIKEFRKNIWESIDNHFSNDAFNLLESYEQKSLGVIKEIMEYDISFVCPIIKKHLTPDSFKHCRYVQEQIRRCKREEVKHSSFESLSLKFTNPLYKMFLKIHWDRFRDKEMYEFHDYGEGEYEKLKEAEVRSSFVFKNKLDMKLFYKDFIYLKKIEEEKNGVNYDYVFDIIVDENCSRNFDLGCQLLIEVMENNIIGYVPRIVFRNQLLTETKVNHIWDIVQSNKNFADKSRWELSFYDNIADSLITDKYIPAIKNSILKLNSMYTIYLGGIQRFTRIDSQLLECLLDIIVHRNESGDKLCVHIDLPYEPSELLNIDISLIKKTYIQQTIIQNYFDYQKNLFFKILIKDPHFLIEYVNALYLKDPTKHYLDNDEELRIVWEIDNIEPIMKEVFDLTDRNEPYLGILKHFCNSFFWNISGEAEKRAKKFLLDYCTENYRDHNKINIIIDIVRHSMRGLYDQVLLQFISLTQNVELFSNICWRGNEGHFVAGDVIIGDIEASEWREILSIVEQSSVGIKLIPIKQYINSKIEKALKDADCERKRKFIGHW